MQLNMESILKIPEDLVMECVLSKEDNKFNEDVYSLYNPDGYGGILAIGKQVAELIKVFDGKKNIATAINDAGLSTLENDAVACLETLVKKQFLICKDIIPETPAWNRELTCWLHITNDCNLRCKYCYIHKSHSIMPDSIMFEAIDKMIESCKRHDYKDLTLMITGGEAFTRFDKVREIISYCKKNSNGLRIRFTIPTNGTLITPNIAEFIADNHISVGVSVDGIKEYHDLNRIRADGSGSFDKAMEGIENLIKLNVSPSVLVTVTEDNLDGLPTFTKLMVDKGMNFRFSFERDTQTGHPSILNDEKHCIEVLHQCFSIMIDALNEGKTNWRFKFGDVSFVRPKRRACAAGKNFFSIGQDGSIGSCSIGLEKPKAKLNELNDIIPDIQDVFSEIGTTSACDVLECKQCLWRHSCAGACPLQTFATYQTYNHISPHCALYKACLPEVIRINALATYYINKKGGE